MGRYRFRASDRWLWRARWGSTWGCCVTVFGAVTLALVQLARLGRLAGFAPNRTPMDPDVSPESSREGE